MSQNRCNISDRYDISYYMKESFISILKNNDITSERSNQMTRDEIDRPYPTVHVKDQVLGNVLGRTFLDSLFRISHHIHIVRTSCSQLLAISGIFCLLVEFFYRPCGLEVECPTTNLAFLR